MKLSQILFSQVKDLWILSAEKPFVTEMAKGTLADSLFREYMLQDYLYLQDYIGILNRIKSLSPDDDVTAFLNRVIEETKEEAKRVHIQNIKEFGISDSETEKSSKIPAISDYTDFLRRCPDEYGLLGGLTALLQCSWIYAFIGETALEKYPEEIAVSKYKSWFDAYTCQSYLDANRMWIDILDKYNSKISDTETEKMCRIFKKCAVFENKLWDALFH